MLYIINSRTFIRYRKIAYNGRGLAMAGNFINVSPQPQPNRITKDEIKNKKLSKEISARTTADSSTETDDMHVSPAIAKPIVELNLR